MEERTKKNIRKFIFFLKKNNAYIKFLYCAKKYNTEAFNIPKFLARFKYSGLTDLIDDVPFAWSGNCNEPNYNSFWRELGEKWNSELISQRIS